MANVKISNLTALWDTSSVEYNGIKLNITDTTSSVSSKAIDLQVNSLSVFKVGKTGITTAAAFIGNFTGSLTGSFYGTATTASSLTLANSYNITNLTASNISASGNVSASTIRAASSMTSPIGNITNKADALKKAAK